MEEESPQKESGQQPVIYFSTFSVWDAYAGVQTDKTKESVLEFVKEFKQLSGEQPITADELAAARANRIRGYVQRFDSLSKITDQIAKLWVLSLPLSELQQYTTGIEKVTLTEVNSAARKYVQPSAASLQLVGDLARLNSEIRALNLGKVVILGSDGKTSN